MSNIGYTYNTRLSLYSRTPGVQALTTSLTLLLGPQINTDTRWVLGGSTINNYSDPDDGGGPCGYWLYYVPILIPVEDINEDYLFRATRVEGFDYHQLGEFPVCPGFQIWGKAELNGYLNISLYTEDVE